MLKSPLVILAFVSITLFSPNLWSADAARGEELHDKSCLTACHSAKAGGVSNDLYKRPNRRNTLAKLTAMVTYCNQQVLDSEWWPEDEADVVAYLNSNFYHFK
ncbi:MAG: cytochrome c [Magnetococcales bacterium]|nr:cytochrome c [Magnetococcales bacterium]